MRRLLLALCSIALCSWQNLAADITTAQIEDAMRSRLRAATAERLDPRSVGGCPATSQIALPTTFQGVWSSFDSLSSVETYSDVYAFNGRAGETVTIELASRVVEVFLYMPNAGSPTRVSYLSSGEAKLRLVYTLPSTRTYEFLTSALYERSTGSYTVVATTDATSPGPSGPVLSLLNNRFKITLTARDQRTGKVAEGVAIPMNDLFGYFAIPGLTGDTRNPEVFVKMLDGQAVNGKFWVFYGGLTDLEYTLTVTDPNNPYSPPPKQYHKEPGSSCGGFDTNAF